MVGMEGVLVYMFGSARAGNVLWAGEGGVHLQNPLCPYRVLGQLEPIQHLLGRGEIDPGEVTVLLYDLTNTPRDNLK